MYPIPFPALRMRNIFAPDENVTAQIEEPSMPPVQEGINVPSQFDPAQRMRELYTPETEATDRFNQLTQNMPQYNPHQGKLRSLAAAIIAGTQGANAGRDALMAPYNYEMNQWKQQIGPAQAAANLERQGNINERQLAAGTVNQELATRKVEETERKNKATQDIQNKRNEIYEWKAKHPNMKIIAPKGGNIKGVDPISGQTVMDFGPAGTMSDADRLEIEQSGALQRAEIGAAGRSDVAETRGWIIANIPDPNDPTKQIAVRMNQATGLTEPIKLGDKQVGPVTKPGTKGAETNTNLQAIQDKTRETLSALDELLDDKGKLRPEIKTAVGASRMLGLQYLPATQTRAADTAINRLKSMLIVDLIGEMKAQSKTGATGFGQLNIRELQVLERAASKLDPSLGEGVFEAELNRIRERLKKVLQPDSALTPTVTTKPPTGTPLSSPPPAPPGWKYVPKPGGGFTAVRDQ